MPELILAIILIVMLLIIFLPCFKKGATDKIIIVERLGMFLKTLDESKIYFLIPFIDRVIQTVPIGVATKTFSFTLDKEEIASYTYRYEVFDFMLFVYEELDSFAAFEKQLIKQITKTSDYNLILGESINQYAESLGMKILDLALISKNNS